MKRSMLFLALFLFPLTAIAGERVSGTNFYLVNQESWKTGKKSGYFMWNAEGIQHSAEH